MKAKTLILCMLLPYLSNAEAQIRQSFQVQDYRIEKVDGYDKIISEGAELRAQKVGYPELPSYKKTFLVPRNASNIHLNIQNVKKKKVAGTYLIYPTQEIISVGDDGNQTWIDPQEEIYSSALAYPGEYGKILSDYFYLGYRLVDVLLFPFEYNPAKGELYLCNIDFSIDYNEFSKNLEVDFPVLNQSDYITNLNRRAIKSIVENPQLANSYNLNIKSIAQGNSAWRQSTTYRVNSLNVPMPEYIIITVDSLKESFYPFAEWKTKKGIYTIIQSTEKIENNYDGNDLQEKIRNYIIDSRKKWGSVYILLGGDADIIPPRMIPGDSLRERAGTTNHKLLYAADMYYSTYNGTWNNNKNTVYKEVKYADESIGVDLDVVSADYNMGVVLGRLPVKDKKSVSVLTNKIISYEKALGIKELDYFKNNLYSDAYISEAGGRLSDFAISSIKDYVKSYALIQNNRYICDNANCTGDVNRYGTCINPPNGDIELNRENFLTAINSGSNLDVGHFHFIYHMDHSKATGIGTSSTDKGQSVSMDDMKSLTNAPYYQILMSGSCNSANFYYEDGVAKSYLLNPTGGGVAWIGNTDTGYASEHKQLSHFLRSLYSPSAETYDIGRAYQASIAGSAYYNISRWRLHLLGDPEMQVWTDTPKNMTVQINPGETMPCGEGTVNVTVSGIQAADEEVRICLYKKDEVFAPVTMEGNGTHTFTGIHPLTPGDLYVTVTAHNYLPVEDTITVTPNPNQHVYFKELAIDDDNSGSSRGNDNGQADAGEALELSLALANNGLKAARGVTATLGCTSPYVTVHTAQAAYGDIAAGGSAIPQTRYVVQIDPEMPETAQGDPDGLAFTLEVTDADGHSFSGTFGMDVHADELHLGNRSFVGDGTLAPGRLQNTGKATATGLQGTLKDAAGNTVCTRTYPAIGQNETASSTTTYAYTLPATYAGGPLPMTLEVVNGYGKAWAFPLDLSETRLPTPTGANFTADLTSINLYWDVQPGVAGYTLRCGRKRATHRQLHLLQHVLVVVLLFPGRRTGRINHLSLQDNCCFCIGAGR